MDHVLEVNNITKLYKNGRGIDHIGFHLAKGDIFGLIGPNGAGKTTLLKIIMGLMKPDKGSIRIFEHGVADFFEQAMKHVGCLIETADAIDYMSGYENLKLSARFYPGLPKNRIDQVLDQVGLTRYKKEKVKDYSLGMKQRLGIASALLSNPKLVILDEPLNGLDIEGIVDIRNTIQQLAKDQGITFLVSSHMIHDLGMVVNRIGIMNHGYLIRVSEGKEWLKEGVTLEQYVIEQIRAMKGGDVFV